MTIIHKKEDFLFEPGDIVVSELSGIDKKYIYDFVIGYSVGGNYHIVSIMIGKSKTNFRLVLFADDLESEYYMVYKVNGDVIYNEKKESKHERF